MSLTCGRRVTHRGLDLTAKLRLIDPAYPQPGVPKFLLFDEGQDTYEDEYLWNTFFKRVHDGLFHYHVILFCSYGSPSTSPVTYRIGTPPRLRSAARVSLWQEKDSVGLLLNPTEFNEVVARYSDRPDRHVKLDPKLRAHFYNLTGGHVGALVELLYLISYQVSLDETNHLDFLTTSRGFQKHGRDCRSQLTPLMQKIQLSLSSNGFKLGG
jgi:hypothetical protein